MGGDYPFERGYVVWVEWPDYPESGPFLTLSDEANPNHVKVYIGVLLSTTYQEHAVRITESEWETGGQVEFCPHVATLDNLS